MHTYIISVNGDQSVKHAEDVNEAVRQWADINSDIRSVENLFSEFDHVTITKQPVKGNEWASCGDECSVRGLLSTINPADAPRNWRTSLCVEPTCGWVMR
jgi:hypothetical protein